MVSGPLASVDHTIVKSKSLHMEEIPSLIIVDVSLIVLKRAAGCIGWKSLNKKVCVLSSRSCRTLS